MVAASFTQSAFLGGAWSKRSQGRTDMPKYRQALNTCKNFIPAEEGSLPRRPGFEYTGSTRSGNAAKLISYHVKDNGSFAMEFTDGYVRMQNGPGGPVYDYVYTVTACTTGTPARITVVPSPGQGACPWQTGDILDFYPGNDGANYPDEWAGFKARPLQVTRVDSTHFDLADAITGDDIDGSTMGVPGTIHNGMVGARICETTTPWADGVWSTLRAVQNQDFVLLLHSTTSPYSLAFKDGTVGSPSTMTLAKANMLDGPYNDPDTSGAWLRATILDATKPNIVGFYISFPGYDANKSYNRDAVVVDGDPAAAYISLLDNNTGHTPASSPTQWAVSEAQVINGAAGFTTDDIGRCVRVLCEPVEWDDATKFAKDTAVTFNGGYYISQADNNINVTPDTNTDFWIPTNSQSIARWTWGRIVAVAADRLADPAFTLQILGDPVLYPDTNTAINTFRLGLYGNGGGAGWPTCGVYHQGRLWLSGAVANRVDGSKSNGFLDFAPTSADGSVADNNAVAYVFNADEENQIMWMQSTGEGIMCGTLRGEWFVRASAQNDPITPTSIQAHRQTKYGCTNVLPAVTPFATVFVQAFGRKVLEMLADVFSGKFSAINITETGRHLTKPGIAELAYQEEPVPIIWVRKTDGTLSGLTYRRNSAFVSEAPSISAWFEVELAGSLTIKSICVLPALSGTAQVLAAVVYDSVFGSHKIIQMVPLMDEDDNIYSSWFMDDASKAYNSLVTTNNGVAGIRAYGLRHLEGQTVDVFIGGLDCGQTAVSGGSAFVAFGADADGLFTLANMQALSIAAVQTYNADTTFSAGSGATAYTVPMLFGHAYESVGQSLRPGTQADSGAVNGPPLGKTRRAHMGALLLHNAVNGTIAFGTSSSSTYPVKLTTAGGTSLARNQLFEGTYQTTLADDYNFDTMLYWKIARPVPAVITQVGAYLHTQDR